MKRRGGSMRPSVVGEYEKHEVIGRGAYGIVHCGYHTTTGQKVAIKEFRKYSKEDETNEEVECMKLCKGQKHTVQLLDVVHANEKLHLILEYMHSDLETQIELSPGKLLSIPLLKYYLQMLLEAVSEVHALNLLHRDLKPDNLLLHKDDKIAKLTDFGLARTTSESDDKMSVVVVTRGYRCPELFFGSQSYGTEVDMWSVGCILAEMATGEKMFASDTDIGTLVKIFKVLGSPNENNWNTAEELPSYFKFVDTNPPSLRTQFPRLSTSGVDLLSKLLCLDPTKRIGALEALDHSYFKEEPLPCSAADAVVLTKEVEEEDSSEEEVYSFKVRKKIDLDSE